MKKLTSLAILLAAAGCESPAPTPEPEAPAAVAALAAPAWFADVTGETKLHFHRADSDWESYLIPEIMGSGGALFDPDGDGDLDLYLVHGAASEGGAPNRMFRREGDGSYTDVTGPSGLGDEGSGMGAALGDVDNDGDLDLFVTNFGPDALYLAAGDGTFRPAAPSAGLDDDLWSASACFLDYDRDGWLDLYVSTYVHFDPPKACSDRAGHRDYCGPEAFRGVRDRLYRGRGDGSFTDVSDAALADRPANRGLGVVCADFDGDGWIDVYVANDAEQNQLWMNRGDRGDGSGGFEDRALLMGAALNLFSQPEASMGIAFGDVDGDLDLDLFMTHLDRETNTLYLNLGEGGFTDHTGASGLGPASLATTGFGTAFFDADLDGDLDLLMANGRVRRSPAPTEEQLAWQVAGEVPPPLKFYAEPDLLFLNGGDGRFTDAGERGGPLTATVDVSRGLLAGDLDDDGDLDLVVTTCHGPARLYRNDVPRLGHWLRVRAVDPELRRDALGATVVVEAGGRSFSRPVTSSSSYLSAVEPEVHFGLAAAERFDRVTVVWPDATREEFPGGEADRTLELRKGDGT